MALRRFDEGKQILRHDPRRKQAAAFKQEKKMISLVSISFISACQSDYLSSQERNSSISLLEVDFFSCNF
jgi:hypothetical protein